MRQESARQAEPGSTCKGVHGGPLPTQRPAPRFPAGEDGHPHTQALLVSMVAAQGEPCGVLGRSRCGAACRMGGWGVDAGSPGTQPSAWGLAPSAWPHLRTGPAPCGQREGKGELWGRGHSRACLEGTGGDPAWVLRAHSGTWRGAAGSSVGAASGGGTAQATALAMLLLLPSDRRGGPGAASVSIACLLCRRPAVWTRIPGEQAGLQQTLGDAGPQGPLETRTCLPETRICVGLEPPLGSLFLNSDPCPCGVISRWALSVMSGHSMSHVWLLATDCPGRSRHLNVLSKRWCAPGAAWPCYSCPGRMRFGGNGINEAARRGLPPAPVPHRTDSFLLKCRGRLAGRSSGSLMLLARFQL